MEENKIKIEVVSGAEGECLIVDGYRVAGTKPWGGGSILKSFDVKIKDLIKSVAGVIS